MAVTEVQETAGSYAGTWAAQSSAAYSGGTRTASGSAGATATFSVSGRAVYLLTSTQEAGGVYGVSVDGQAYQSGSCFGVGPNDRNRVLVPLARNLADGAHTVVLTAASAAPVIVDSLLVVSGAAIAPVAGSLVTLGDSTTAGYGLTNQLSAWPNRLAAFLGHKLNRPFSLANKGVSGDSWFCADAAHQGGMYRLSSEVAPLAPEVLTLLFGINDIFLNATMSGDYIAHLLSALQFVEDVFAVTQMAVVLCTPSYQAPLAWTSAPSGNQGGYYAGTASEHYRLALEMVKQVGAMFSWVTIGYVYECMDECDSLVYPNGGFDSTHPSDGGQSVIAVEVFRSVVERFAKIGKS